jgi:16S rRNA (uracil1498-N3)-methyltransferase
MSLPRFHVAPLDPTPGSMLSLAGPEGRHAARVVRLRPGDRAVAFDGAGVVVTAEVLEVRGERLTLRVQEAHTTATAVPLRITVAPAVLKGDAMDALIRDATMLGATAIAPVVTARTIVPARASAEAGVVERWRRVALASAKQCGRNVLPVIAPARPLDTALAEPTWNDAARLVLCEPELEAATTLPAVGTGPVVVLSGPEGGWTPDEIARATARGWRPWRCSPLVLRAETAPIVALGILGWLAASVDRR